MRAVTMVPRRPAGRRTLSLTSVAVVVLLAVAHELVSASKLPRKDDSQRASEEPLDVGAPRGILWFGNDDDAKSRSRTFLRSGSIQNGGLQSATVSAWVKADHMKRYNWVVGTASRANGFALFLDEGEKACFGLFRQGQLKTISNRGLQLPKAWHYVSGVFDNGTIQVFVDAQPGEVVPLSLRSLSPETWRDGLLVGGSPDFPQLRLDGSIGGVHLWSSARTSSDLAQDMITLPPSAVRPAWASHRPRELVGAWVVPAGEGGAAMEDAVGGADLVAGGEGMPPLWRLSDLPLHLCAEEAEDGAAGLEATIEDRGGGGAIIAIDRLPDHLEPRATLVEAREGGIALGPLPSLPWPLVPGRRLKIEIPVGKAGGHLCGEVALRSSKGKGTTSVFVYGRTRGEGDLDHSQVVESCHFSGRGRGLVRRRADGVGAPGGQSILVFAPDDFGALSAATLGRVGALVGALGRGARCLVFRVADRASRGHVEAMALDLGGGQSCVSYGVSSAVAGLGIAMGVLGDGRALVTTTAAAEALPIGFGDRAARALVAMAGGDPGPFCALPGEDDGPAPACASSNASEAAGAATPMPQETFARAVVSALGGSERWWPLFVTRGVACLRVADLRSVRIGPSSEPTPSFPSAGRTAELGILVGLWGAYVRILKASGAWRQPGGPAEVEGGAIAFEASTADGWGGGGGCQLLSKIVLALRGA